MRPRRRSSSRETILVEVDGPYDLDATLLFLHGAEDPLLRRDGEGRARQAFRTQHGVALVSLKQVPRGVEIEIAAKSGAAAADALKLARRLAGLPAHADAVDSHAKFLKLARRDAALKGAVKTCAGLRIPQRPDPVASLSGAILAQQVTLSFAAKVTRAFWAKYGETVKLEGETWSLSPRAEVAAEARIADLKALQFTERKAEYVRDLCREIAEGELDLFALRDVEIGEAERQLVARRGIGPSTAGWLLMFATGHPDAWAPGDVGLHRAIARLEGGERPDAAATLAWGDRHRGHRTHVAITLWAHQRIVEGRG